jgi:hypothetical protein
MADITPTRVAPNSMAHEVLIITWETVGGADTCLPVELANYADRSIQVAGTFGGATATVQGSNDGTNWATLADPQGNALAITSAKIEALLEVTRYTRVVTTGGTGTDLDITLLARRSGT